MPIYQYKCLNCGKITDEFSKERKESIECPYCQTTAIRIISPSTFILKGDGWFNPSKGDD